MARTTAKSKTKRTPAALKEYRAKRDFTKSPEPSGDEAPVPKKKSAKELFFCVQKHWASHLHYDFRLEWNGVLLSWAVPKGPSLNPRDKRLAMKVEDHPFDYGEFEGVIPEGYGAGIVMLWDRGTWTPESDNVDAALAKGELKFSLNGFKLKGSWVLVRTGGGTGDNRSWLLIKHRDEWAGDIDITTFAPNSIKSGGSFKEILTTQNPEFWESHRNGEAVAGEQLRKVIGKVLAADERGTMAATATTPPRARAKRKASSRTPQSRRAARK